MEEEKQERKNRSLEILRRLGIDYTNELPCTESVYELDFKNGDVVARKAIATLISTQLACDIEDGADVFKSIEYFTKYLEKFGVSNYLNMLEKRIFGNNFDSLDIEACSWEYETFWVLAWALGMVKDITFANDICDCDYAVELISSCNSYSDFRNRIKLKTRSDILDMLDLYYRYDWAILENENDPSIRIGNLNPRVVIERRRGLEWLVSKYDDWFDISLDF